MKNRRWLFSTPRHHAHITTRPAEGKRIRVNRIVRARVASLPGALNPLAMTDVIGPANRTPSATPTATIKARMAATAPAVRPASSSFPSRTRPAYTGMNEAESEPSPNRLFRIFGIRDAYIHASAAIDWPSAPLRKWVRTRPRIRERKMPAATNTAPLRRGTFFERRGVFTVAELSVAGMLTKCARGQEPLAARQPPRASRFAVHAPALPRATGPSTAARSAPATRDGRASA